MSAEQVSEEPENGKGCCCLCSCFGSCLCCIAKQAVGEAKSHATSVAMETIAPGHEVVTEPLCFLCKHRACINCCICKPFICCCDCICKSTIWCGNCIGDCVCESCKYITSCLCSKKLWYCIIPCCWPKRCCGYCGGMGDDK
eukprot:91313_1